MENGSVEKALFLLDESAQALLAHVTDCGHAFVDIELRTEIRRRGEGANTLFVEIWWVNCPSRMAQQLCWETQEIRFEQPAELDRYLSLVEKEAPAMRIRRSATALKFPPAQTTPQLPPLFQYHPERFRATFPSAKKAAQLATAREDEHMAVNAIAATMIPAENQRRAETPLRKLVASHDKRGIQRLLELSMVYGRYHYAGRQIFDIPKNLSAMFKNTDIDDIPVSLLKFPYECFYLHFGVQSDLQLAPGWHADGAYVYFNAAAGSFLITVTTAPDDPHTYGKNSAFDFEPAYTQSIPQKLLDLGLGEAVETVFAESFQELQKQARGDSPLTQDIAKHHDALAKDGIQLADVTQRNARAELATLDHQHQCYLSTLRLVVNTIAYLSAYPEDAVLRWPDNTPASLRAQVETGTPKHQARAQSKLASLGFTPVHFAGQRFLANKTASDALATGDRTVVTHWRRGYWRRQRFGPNRTQQKLLWLWPVLVNAEHATESTPAGHIYLVT